MKLTAEELDQALERLPGWELRDDGLHKEFEFDNFSGALGFMIQVALSAERLNHHPDWSNRFNKVAIKLQTHTASGVTGKDVDLAKAINEILA